MGVVSQVGRGLVALGVVGCLVALFRLLFLEFLQEGMDVARLGEASLRVHVAVLGIAGIDVYERLMRAPDRDVLSILPVNAYQVVASSMRRLMIDRFIVLLSAMLLFAPVGLAGFVPQMVAAMIGVASVFFFAYPAAGLAHLGAVELARSARFAPLLDLIRGANPRSHAAFVYAPGALLAVGSGVAYSASLGPTWVLANPWVAALGLSSGFALGGLCGIVLPRVAGKTWYRASSVLSEGDAAVKAVSRDEGDHGGVYLDWLLRWLPANEHRYAIRDLRHGWRALRPRLQFAWIFGLLAASAAYSEEPRAIVVALALTALGCAITSSVGLALGYREDTFLFEWLPNHRPSVLRGRFCVLTAWCQPVILPAVMMVWFMVGWQAAIVQLVIGELTVALVASLALLCAKFSRMGTWMYAFGGTLLVMMVVVLLQSTRVF